MNKYAVTTDIEKAFLQVGLEEDDRNYTRFFWLRDCNDPSSEIVTYRFKVVLFGATCSPFILHATLLKLFQDNSSTTSEELEKSLYVDNVLTSFSDEEILLSFYTEARQLLQKGGFNLRTWNSNSSRLRSQAVTDCVEDSSQNVKILGMRWNVDNDKLSYPHLDFTDTTSKTKREVLSQSSKLFDPLGFLSPVTIRAKLFIQELWKQNYTWDVPLPQDITDNWDNILQDLSITQLQDDSQGQLHIFTDASQYAYGACAYLVHGEQSILLMSKNRVAPLKTPTLPRMELMGATIGAQLCSHLQSVLNVNSVTLWCDSQIVLHWLKSHKLLKRFISKRINEIKELTGTHEWRYVPTDNNPADLQTRGIPASELLESNFWIHGPEWITNQSNWPIGNFDVTLTMMSQTQQEMKQNDEVEPGSSENSKNVSPIFSLEKYSSYSKILRVTAFVFRFINNCKTTTEKRTQGPIKPIELNRATKYWIRIAQTYFGEVFECLRSGRRNDLIRQLKLYIDSEGMIRSKGRIHNAKLPQDTKFPLLLPKTHSLTKRIVIDTHKRNLHSGPETTIVILREKFWIPSIRQVVQHCIRNCVPCRKVTGNHFRAPDPPPLPKDRLRENTPFTVTGVDFTGALHVKTGNRMDKKVYICLFTCASTHAIHLEIVTDLTENSFFTCISSFRK